MRPLDSQESRAAITDFVRRESGESAAEVSGLRRLAALNHEAACKTADALGAVPGVEVVNKSYFNEFTLRLPKNAEGVVNKLANDGVLAGVPGGRLWPDVPEAENLLIVAATECATDADIDTFTAKLREAI